MYSTGSKENSGGQAYVLHRLQNKIERELLRLGLFYRLFSRVKTQRAVEEKIARKSYRVTGAKLTDLIGVRVVVYFAEDVHLVEELLGRAFIITDRTVDEPGGEVFGSTRFNITLQIPGNLMEYLDLGRYGGLVDSTFEIQIRTVLSEGWHEVEHDLRYKASDDWVGKDDLSRTLNGILATLETCDWSMKSLFDGLSYRHYKEGNWAGMVRTKFRMRLGGFLRADVKKLLSQNKALAKEVFRLDRQRLLQAMLRTNIDIPLTYDHLVFLANRIFIEDDSFDSLEPPALRRTIENAVREAKLLGEDW